MNSPGRNGDSSYGADGSHDEGLPVIVVPDDISELDAEVQQYRRELRRARRRAKWRTVSLAPFRWMGRGARRFARLFRFFHPW
jgi:hypothetical protein